MKNPKLKGSGIVECKPQAGPCPMDCNQCYYNRNEEYKEVGIWPPAGTEKIVRVNAGNDSNHLRNFVIEMTEGYKHKFYNTSVACFDFPGPVVFTANPQEEKRPRFIEPPVNLMFVRLRVSSTNLDHIREAIVWYVYACQVPVVLTYMAYYTDSPFNVHLYEWRRRHVNSYWCPKEKWKKEILRGFDNRLVSNCDYLCKDCMTCESQYWTTLKRMKVHET